MSKPIEGRNVLLEALKDGDYVAFACSTSVSFYHDTELILKTTPNSAGFNEYAARLNDWGLTLNTLTHVAPTDNMYTVFDTMLTTLRKQGLDIRLTFEDEAGNIKEITGHVLIPRSEITAPEVGFSEDVIELKGSGLFAITTTITTPPGGGATPEVMKLEFTSNGGETSVTFAQLIGKDVTDILYYSRDLTDREVIGFGTPNAKQVKFIPATGTFEQSSTLSAGEYHLILYK